MKRSTRQTLAEQTVVIAHQGYYKLPDGRVVSIAEQVEDCLRQTSYHTPEDLNRLRKQVLAGPALRADATIELRNETTLQGIARMFAERVGPVAALNFASAKNPGGGFLGGSHAQEESLARSSALYASLLQAPEYYERHRKQSSCLYSDAMIVSPDCPVFRNDEGDLLEQPLPVTFITSAAPNAGAIGRNEPAELSCIPEAFRQRSERVLALAASLRIPTLILGPWGCGVFRNDPTMVARTFADHLKPGGHWRSRFERIAFSVLDTSAAGETFRAFEEAFAT
jgi:uncharacterized protein (TIGR02452 family)